MPHLATLVLKFLTAAHTLVRFIDVLELTYLVRQWLGCLKFNCINLLSIKPYDGNVYSKFVND